MNRASQSPEPELAQAELLRNRTFRAIRRITLAASAAAFVLFTALGAVVRLFPTAFVLSGIAVFIVMLLFSEWLARRRRYVQSRLFFILGLTACLLALTYFANGITGPFIVVLVSVPVMAQLIGGERGWLWTLTVGALYLLMMVLELLGLASQIKMARAALYMSSGILFVATLIIIGAIVRVFVRQSESTLDILEQRGRELAELTRRAEQAAHAEREAREQQQRTAQQLRQAVQHYSAFLERVASGEYDARLDLDQVGEGIESKELGQLGQRLNATVESLVSALQDLQTVQRRYVRESWEAAMATEERLGWKYGEGGLQPAEQEWRPAMTRAVQDKITVTEPSDLAQPLTLRGEVIGALNAHRGESAGWREDEIALIQAVTDQLAQTMDGMRLLEETQRRAAQEQLVGQVTARMRESLDIDKVLRTASEELYQVLGLEELVISLTPAEPADDHPVQ